MPMAAPDPAREQRIEWALHMHEAGFALFPLRKMEKVPITPNGFLDATRDETRIRTFLGNVGTTGYGIVWPEVYEGDPVVCWDIDGLNWRETLSGLAQRFGPLPKSDRTKSPHGFHLFYRVPRDLADALIAANRAKMLGFVVRTPWRGYVCGPGTETSDGIYVLQGPGVIERLPEHWVEAVWSELKRQKAVVPTTTAPLTPLIVLRDDPEGYSLPQKVLEGSRYDAIRDYVAHLYNRKLDAEEALALVQTVLAPRFEVALTPHEVEERFQRTWKDIDKRLGEPHPPGSGVTLPPMALPRADVFPDPPDSEAFDGLAGVVAGNLMQVTSASQVGLLSALLTVWSGMFGTTFHLYETQQTGLFTVLVGATGSGRKGTTTRTVWQAIERAITGTPGRNKIVIGLGDQRWDGVASGQGWVRQLADAKVRHGLAIEEEFENVLRQSRSSRDYASTLATTIQKAFDAAYLQHVTVRGTIRVPDGYTVAILGNVTREVLRTLLPPEMTSGGFSNRFLWVPVQEREDAKVTSMGLYPAVAESLRDARDAWEADPSPPILTDPALALVNEYYAYLHDLTGLQSQFSRRLHVIAARIAMTHAMLDRDRRVDPAMIRRGIAITEYCRRGLLWAFSLKTGDEWLDAVVAALVEAGDDGLTATEVARLCQNHAPRIQRIRDTGLEAGVLSVTEDSSSVSSRGGRPIQRWRAARRNLLGGFPLARARDAHTSSVTETVQDVSVEQSVEIEDTANTLLTTTEEPSNSPELTLFSEADDGQEG